MPTSANRTAANQANAHHSTGPKTAEGKARSSQNARKHPFNPDPFAVVRIEDPARIASLLAGAIATYQPINSQERDAVERIALAQHSMRRLSTLEAGFFTNCLDEAMAGPAEPSILNRSEIANGVDVTLEQGRAYWLAFGFNRYTRQSPIASTFLRFQAQAERLYRRAVEDFDRLFKLRGQLPPEKYEENEPKADPQSAENTADPDPAPAENPETNPRPTRRPRPPRRLTGNPPPTPEMHPPAAIATPLTGVPPVKPLSPRAPRTSQARLTGSHQPARKIRPPAAIGTSPAHVPPGKPPTPRAPRPSSRSRSRDSAPPHHLSARERVDPFTPLAPSLPSLGCLNGPGIPAAPQHRLTHNGDLHLVARLPILPAPHCRTCRLPCL